MDLFHVETLALQRDQHVTHVVALLEQPDHPVRGTGAGRPELVAVAAAHRPLDLDAHPEPQAVRGRRLDLAAGEPPRAAGVHVAVLGAAVDRGPGPARLCVENDEPVEVRDVPQVPVGAPERAGTGQRHVVGPERVRRP